jgi:hypothetical protein
MADASILGQPCKPTWTFRDPGQGYDYMAAYWVQAFQGAVLATGALDLPTGSRTYRIICDGHAAAIHPDDAGWVVRAVEPWMRRVKPIWMQAATTRVLPNGARVSAGLFPWLPRQWTCPECWPKLDLSGTCNDDCSVTKIMGSPHLGLRALYGYDNRAMRPWVTNVNAVPSCNQGAPGGPNTLCLPVEGFCRFWSAKAYLAAFWQDVAQASTAYNINRAARREQEKTTPKPAPVSTPKPQPKRDVNWLPLLAVGLGTGILGVFMWNLRR